MSSVFEPSVLAALVTRFEGLRPETQGRWGVLTVNEMLCHLADCTDWARGIRPTAGIQYPTRVHWSKWIALYTPLPWPRTIKTGPRFDPKVEGTRPAEFERDRRRAIESMVAMANTGPAQLVPAHMVFGPMTPTDWGRWAYRHAHHHLRQFGC